MTESSTIFCYAEIDEAHTTLNQVLEQLRAASIGDHDVLGVVLCDTERVRIPGWCSGCYRYYGINVVVTGVVNPDIFGSYWMGPYAQITLCGRTYLGEPVTKRRALLAVESACGPGGPGRMLGYQETERRLGL